MRLATSCLLVIAICNVRLTHGVRLATILAPKIAKTWEREKPVAPRIQVFARSARTAGGMDLIASKIAVKDVSMADARKQMEDVRMGANQAFGTANVLKLVLKRPWEHVIAIRVCQMSAKKAAIRR